jgi:hypothetical protein
MANTIRPIGEWEARDGEAPSTELHTKNHDGCPGCSLVRLMQFMKDVRILLQNHAPRCMSHQCPEIAMWRLTMSTGAGGSHDVLMCDGHNHGPSRAIESAPYIRRLMGLLG